MKLPQSVLLDVVIGVIASGLSQHLSEPSHLLCNCYINILCSLVFNFELQPRICLVFSLDDFLGGLVGNEGI